MANSRQIILPFDATEVQEIHLNRSPLVLTIAQIRFSEQFVLSNPQAAEGTISELGSRIRKEYPQFRSENVVNFQLSPNGVSPQETPNTQWVFASADGKWQLTLTRDVLTLASFDYTTRDDFLSRWSAATAVLVEVVGIVTVTRIGVRYVNRIDAGDQPDLIAPYFRPELRSTSPDFAGGVLVQSITDLFFRLPTHSLHARAGLLPPEVFFDPSIEPLHKPSWVFDIDVFVEMPFEASPESLSGVSRSLAESAYRFFRWGVTEEFMDAHGD